MRILAMDSAAGSVSAAVLEDEQILCEAAADTGRNASAELLPAVDFVLRTAGLRPAEVDLFACTAGPGSFTGLRIGIATAKGFCLALGKPLAGVSTLKALACNPDRPGIRICSMIDARKGQVYAALYETDRCGKLRQLHPDGLFDAMAYVRNLGSGVLFVGSGAGRYAEEIRSFLAPDAAIAADRDHRVRASAVGRLGLQGYRQGNLIDPIAFAPVYLRASDAEQKPYEPERS